VYFVFASMAKQRNKISYCNIYIVFTVSLYPYAGRLASASTAAGAAAVAAIGCTGVAAMV
jgi:hypothetical protein